jgi:hypothetical protein
MTKVKHTPEDIIGKLREAEDGDGDDQPPANA